MCNTRNIFKAHLHKNKPSSSCGELKTKAVEGPILPFSERGFVLWLVSKQKLELSEVSAASETENHAHVSPTEMMGISKTMVLKRFRLKP